MSVITIELKIGKRIDCYSRRNFKFPITSEQEIIVGKCLEIFRSNSNPSLATTIRDSPPPCSQVEAIRSARGDWIADENQTTSLLILADNSLPVRSQLLYSR